MARMPLELFFERVVRPYCLERIASHAASEALLPYGEDIAQGVCARFAQAYERTRPDDLGTLLSDHAAAEITDALDIIGWTPDTGRVADLPAPPAGDPLDARSRFVLLYQRAVMRGYGPGDERPTGAEFLDDLRRLLRGLSLERDPIALRIAYAAQFLESDAELRASRLTPVRLCEIYNRVIPGLPGSTSDLDATFLGEIGIAAYNGKGASREAKKELSRKGDLPKRRHRRV